MLEFPGQFRNLTIVISEVKNFFSQSPLFRNGEWAMSQERTEICNKYHLHWYPPKHTHWTPNYSTACIHFKPTSHNIYTNQTLTYVCNTWIYWKKLVDAPLVSKPYRNLLTTAKPFTASREVRAVDYDYKPKPTIAPLSQNTKWKEIL